MPIRASSDSLCPFCGRFWTSKKGQGAVMASLPIMGAINDMIFLHSTKQRPVVQGGSPANEPIQRFRKQTLSGASHADRSYFRFNSSTIQQFNDSPLIPVSELLHRVRSSGRGQQAQAAVNGR